MAARAVEWVLIVYYGPAAHQAAYGRQVRSGGYTKDYIQLSRKKQFLDEVANLFAVAGTDSGSVALTYQWPAGSASGAFVFKSADRPHLKWETNVGAPRVWKMSLHPSDSTSETIPGDPSHLDFAAAEHEFQQIASRGAGQPYLLAIKLRDEPRTFHLRVYLKNPSAAFSWADIALAPQEVQALAAKTTQKSALAWSLFQGGGIMASPKVEIALSQLDKSADRSKAIDALEHDTGQALTAYLRNPAHGLFFDATKNHDAWIRPAPLPPLAAAEIDDLLKQLETRFPASPAGDAAAEALDADPEEVEAFRKQIEQQSYAVPDSTSTIKTRGSAQRAFARQVKANYENRCAITGVATKDFLVAAHIVPWSEDANIRLDPSNGICLSLLVDRAFEEGYLQIADDLSIEVDWSKVGDDGILGLLLKPYDGQKLRPPLENAPKPEYLLRRRRLVGS